MPAQEARNLLEKEARENESIRSVEADTKYVKQKLKGRIDFSNDTYGAVHLAVLRAVHEHCLDDPEDEDDEPDLNVWHVLIHVLLVHVFSIALQIGAIFILDTFVNSTSVDTFQELNWKAFDGQTRSGVNLVNATTMLQNAIASDIPLNEKIAFNMNILRVCDRDQNVPLTTEIFLLVLTLTFVRAILDAVWTIYLYMAKVEDEDEYGNFLLADPDDKTCKKQVVSYASRNSKILIVLLDLLPKIVISGYTFFIGAGFLVLAQGVIKVVLKCMGVTLIQKFSSVMFASLVEADTAKLVQTTSIAFAKEKDEPHQELQKLWVYPFLKVVLALLLTTYFVHIQYGDIHRLRNACYDYGNHFIAPQCILHWPCGQTHGGLHFYNGVASFKAAGLN